MRTGGALSRKDREEKCHLELWTVSGVLSDTEDHNWGGGASGEVGGWGGGMTNTFAGGGGFLPKGSEDPNGSFLSVLLKKSSDEVPLKGSFSLKGSPPNGSRKKTKKGACQKTLLFAFYWLVSTSMKKQKTKCLLRSQQKAKRRAGDLDWRLKSLRYVVNTA